MVGAEPHVIGRALVRKSAVGGERRVHAEMRFVGEDRAQRPRRRVRLQRAMQHGVQVSRREVHAAIGAIGAGADSGGVGGPHG
jgi:hypothetical protein